MNSTCVGERTRAGDENESDGVRMTRAATATIPFLSSLDARIVRTESLAHPADALPVTLRRPCTTSQIARQPDVPDSQRQRASQRGKEQLDNADSDSKRSTHLGLRERVPNLECRLGRGPRRRVPLGDGYGSLGGRSGLGGGGRHGAKERMDTKGGEAEERERRG